MHNNHERTNATASVRVLATAEQRALNNTCIRDGVVPFQIQQRLREEGLDANMSLVRTGSSVRWVSIRSSSTHSPSRTRLPPAPPASWTISLTTRKGLYAASCHRDSCLTDSQQKSYLESLGGVSTGRTNSIERATSPSR